MPALPVPRQEAFAQALAMDLSPSEASSKAGYANNWKHTRQRAERSHIVARVTELRDAPTPAARGPLAATAKLKDRPEYISETPEIRARFMPLSDEDWVAKYGHLA